MTGHLYNDPPLLKVAVTALSQVLSIDTRGIGTATFAMASPSTFAAHQITFEASLDSTNGVDGTWFLIQVLRSDTLAGSTATASLNVVPTYSFRASVRPYPWVRMRCTSHTSGTANWVIARAEG